MPTRRALALPPLLPGPALARGSAATGGWSWKVMRNGVQIGTHVVRVTARGGQRVTESDVSVTPRVLGVVVYRFEHRYTEVTEGWRFREVRSWHNRNGRITEMTGRATPEAVLIEATEGNQRLPANAAPLSWWDATRLGGVVPIFGTTTGKLMDLRWTRRALPDGGFAVGCAGEVDAECLFGRDGNWTGYSTKGDDGSTVSYESA